MDLPNYNEKTVNKTLKKFKVALFIVAYNAERHIGKTIQRIPNQIINKFRQIYIIDDCSVDNTFNVAVETTNILKLKNCKVYKTPFNMGYGGNQKVGYEYAIRNNFDYVILLHGDGQYAPEFLPKIIELFADSKISAVFGSRMMTRYQALKGGMPFYKWVGNQVLTWTENVIMGSKLSEFHSGYRGYSVSSLKLLPFQLNSNNFHFDTEIIIQLIANKLTIKEFPIPTRYGGETCHVNGMNYFWNCIKSVIKYRLYLLGIFYQPNFESEKTLKRNYKLKRETNSLHYYVLNNLNWLRGDVVVDIGANDGMLSAAIAPKVRQMVAVDIKKPESFLKVKSIQMDLNSDFDVNLGIEKYEKAIALDIIEHLAEPEIAMKRMVNLLKNNGLIYISTANIAFIAIRLALVLGWFNYGKKGILDKTHHRLFTIDSFKRLLENSGLVVEKVVGFGPPIADEISDKGLFGIIDKILGWLAKRIPTIFSFNYLIIARKKTPFDEIYKLTTK